MRAQKTDDQVFQCKYCQKEFPKKDMLEYHVMISHRDEYIENLDINLSDL